MSSDNCLVEIVSKNGCELVFRTFETGNGGFLACGYVSRSFVLGMLSSPLTNGRPSLLETDLPDVQTSDWFIDEAWFRVNVGRYIASYEILERVREVVTNEQEEALRQRLEKAGLTNDALTQHAPSALCRAIVTDERWIRHVEPGDRFGTTAYDVWIETEQ